MSLAGLRLIELPSVAEERGILTWLEAGAQIPFAPRRVFYIREVPSGAMRGGHAHRRSHALLIAAAGAFRVALEDRSGAGSVVRLDRPDRALLLPPLVWHRLEDFAPGSLCLVISSETFAETDYIRDHAGFRVPADA